MKKRKRELWVGKQDQVEMILDACGDGYTGARDRALFALLWRTGLRAGEALSLEMADVSHDGKGLVVRVRRPKGHAREENPAHPREIGLDRRAEEIYKEWIKERGTWDGPVFCNRRQGPISSSYYRRHIKRIARRAGIEGRIHMHGLRHGFAHSIYAETDPITTQKALGHTDLSTTLVYLSLIGSNPEIVEATRNRTW